MTEPAYSLDAVLLTQPTCSLCEQAKALLARLTADYPLTVTALEFSSPEGLALAERHGLPFSPALVLGGEPFGYGRIAERALRREIERRLAGQSGAATSPMSARTGRIRSVAGRLIRGW